MCSPVRSPSSSGSGPLPAAGRAAGVAEPLEAGRRLGEVLARRPVPSVARGDLAECLVGAGHAGTVPDAVEHREHAAELALGLGVPAVCDGGPAPLLVAIAEDE